MEAQDNISTFPSDMDSLYVLFENAKKIWRFRAKFWSQKRSISGSMTDEKHPEEIEEESFHPKETTVRCSLWAGETIGLYLFKNYAAEKVTVQGNIIASR